MTADPNATIGATPSETGPNPGVPPEAVVVETRFGCYEFTAANRVDMPQGPLGFQDRRSFGLGNLPGEALEPFKLLQSLDDPDLCFIVTALPADGGPVAAEDLEEVCHRAGMALDEAIFLLIVTIRPGPESKGITMTVNLRAPIVFNPRTRVARQCVSSNADYRVQQPFYGWAEVS